MPGSIDLSPSEHVVDFYGDDAQLARTVVARFAAPLRAGRPVVLIADSAHRRAFHAAFSTAGADIVAAAGAIVWRDATEIAAQLIADGRVDRAIFDAVIGTLVRGLSKAGERTVHIYGEIVSVLWANGHVLAAIELEQLWNGLLDDVPISLLCGYRAGSVAGGDATLDDYHALCATHASVLGGPPIAADSEASWRFPAIPTAVRQARHVVAQTMQSWRRTELAPLAALVVSELATNAIQHAESAFTVSLARTGRAVRIAVGDMHPGLPHVRALRADQPHGRGLQLIGRLSSRWGHDVVSGGKLVWAEITEAVADRR